MIWLLGFLALLGWALLAGFAILLVVAAGLGARR